VKGLATALSGVLVCVCAPGCLTVADDEGPILSIELYWDQKTETTGFSGGTCRSAGVASMEWKLIRTDVGGGTGRDAGMTPDGGMMAEEDNVVADGNQKCTDALDVLEPERGEYKLEVIGYDEAGEALWSQRTLDDNDEVVVEPQPCDNLVVLRFNVAYACEIEAAPPAKNE
jgi:hypothetical protein